MSSSQPFATCPLPEGRNLDGRPVWEPPIFAYDELIGENYEKRREAALKYTGGDAARATKIMDVSIEWDLYLEYDDWVEDNIRDVRNREVIWFFDGLSEELYDDFGEIRERYNRLNIEEGRKDDGTWVITEHSSPRRGWNPRDENSLPSHQAKDSQDINNPISQISSPTMEDEGFMGLQHAESSASRPSLAGENQAIGTTPPSSRFTPMNFAKPEPLALHLVSLCSSHRQSQFAEVKDGPCTQDDVD